MQKPLVAIGAISAPPWMRSTSPSCSRMARTMSSAWRPIVPLSAGLESKTAGTVEKPADCETDPLTELENAVTDAFGQAIRQFQRDFRISRADFIGLHGQTIWHPAGKTLHAATGGWATARKIPAHAGGEPLPPCRCDARWARCATGTLYHAALASKLEQPLIVLNLGGVWRTSPISMVP